MAIHPGDVLLRRLDGRGLRVIHKLYSRIAPERPSTHVVVIELRSAEATPRIWTLAQPQSDLAEGLLEDLNSARRCPVRLLGNNK